MDNERIQYCKIPQCKTCKNKQLDTTTEFHSNLTKKSFEVDFRQNCKTNIVIYLISCKHPNCTLKYVGRTNHAISRRLALHRANIIAKTEGPAMLHHFTKIHQPSDMVIKAIEVCSKANIKERERFWFLELNTAFPYGLNDRIDTPPIQDAYSYTINNTSTNQAIYETFNKQPSRRTKKAGSRRNRRQQQPSYFNPTDFMNNILNTTCDRKELFINSIRTLIMALNKQSTKQLFLHLSICINEHNNLYHQYNSNQYTSYLTYACRDITFAKLKAMYYTKKPKSTRHFMVINFSNKLMNYINLHKIFNNNSVSNLFPTIDDNTFKKPTISFKYSKTIKSKITNYRQTIHDDNIPTQCDCHTHDAQYKVNDHVFTGNLNIIHNKELRSLLKKGLNHRETPPANKDTIIKTLSDSIDSYIQQTSNATKQPDTAFTPWKTEILRRLQIQLQKVRCHKHKNILSKQTNITELSKLQQKWVFTPTDKAANNISIICKKHYMDILHNEIHNSGNFVKVNQSTESILEQQSNFVTKHNLSTDIKMPFLYWTAKLHKNPYSHRFITSGRDCTTQPLSIHVGYCLKTVLNIIRNNNKFQRKTSKINKCFVIDNRNPVTNFIRQSNRQHNTHSISTYDFKTLYTSIPHDKLKQSLATTIRSAFKSRKKKFISVSGKSATLTDERKSSFSLSLQQLIDCVNFIIDNSYIKYRGEVFRQCIGIPMGTNCAPDVANLFLHAYEQLYIEHLINTNQSNIALALSNMFRYQDDCIIFNDNGIFDQHWKNVYPPEMQLEKTNEGNTCTFLDLAIKLENGIFLHQSYDKRKDFGFDIINYPDLVSNIPRAPSYGVFSSQLIRFCDINNELGNFTNDVKLLIDKLVKQHFNRSILKSKFLKFYRNNFLRWSKFGHDILDMINLF